jgi:isopentenyl diphosphate isomerase/L-lactate dehydrogenase-like FMN-dependent dehydrogenase
MGVAMCLSSYSTTSLEEVIKVGNNNPYIIQMCVVRDRNITAQLLRRAEGMTTPRFFVYRIDTGLFSDETSRRGIELFVEMVCAD